MAFFTRLQELLKSQEIVDVQKLGESGVDARLQKLRETRFFMLLQKSLGLQILTLFVGTLFSSVIIGASCGTALFFLGTAALLFKRFKEKGKMSVPKIAGIVFLVLLGIGSFFAGGKQTQEPTDLPHSTGIAHIVDPSQSATDTHQPRDAQQSRDTAQSVKSEKKTTSPQQVTPPPPTTPEVAAEPEPEPVVEPEPVAEPEPEPETSYDTGDTSSGIQPLVSIPEEPAPAPAPAPAPDPEPDVYYKNCDEARAAGAAPLYEGDPGYRPKLDGDHDGVACEP